MATIKEGSSHIIQATFTDENGASVIPDSVLWTLTDLVGNVINSRCDVSVPPAATVEIPLQGDDLLVSDDEPDMARRQVIVEATYTSANHGVLPLNSCTEFLVQRIKGRECT